MNNKRHVRSSTFIKLNPKRGTIAQIDKFICMQIRNAISNICFQYAARNPFQLKISECSRRFLSSLRDSHTTKTELLTLIVECVGPGEVENEAFKARNCILKCEVSPCTM